MKRTDSDSRTKSFLQVVREQESPIEIFHDQTVPIKKSIEFCWKTITGTFKGEHGHRDFIIDDEPPPDEKKSHVHFGCQKWTLSKIHFHRRSEHSLVRSNCEDYSFDAEMHFVHKLEKTDKDFNETLAEPSDLLVLAVFLTECGQETEKLPFTELFKASEETSTGSQIFPPEISQAVVELERFYFYRGSLTSSPYSENVSWVVFERPLMVSCRALDSLRPVAQGKRPGQPWNRRFVLRNFESQGDR